MDKYLSVKTGIIENNHLLTVDMDTWEFLDWNLDTDTYNIIAELIPDGDYKLCWVQKIVKYEDSYLFLQRNSKQLIEYCVDQEKVIRHGLEYLLGDDTYLLYCDAVVLSDKLYMLPYSLDGVITIFDMKTKEYLIDHEIKSWINPKVENYGDGRILSYHIVDYKVWFCLEKSNVVICLNLQTMTSQSFELSSQNGLYKIMGNGRAVFCTENGKSSFYKYDDTINVFREYHLCKQEQSYVFITSSNQNVIAISEEMGCMDIIEDDSNFIKSVKFPDDLCTIFELRNSVIKFSQRIIEKNKLFLLPFSGNGLLEVDLMDYNIKYHCLRISHKDAVYSMNNKKRIIMETSNCRIEDVFYLLDIIQYERSNERTLIGRNIHYYIK